MSLACALALLSVLVTCSLAAGATPVLDLNGVYPGANQYFVLAQAQTAVPVAPLATFASGGASIASIVLAASGACAGAVGGSLVLVPGSVGVSYSLSTNQSIATLTGPATDAQFQAAIAAFNVSAGSIGVCQPSLSASVLVTVTVWYAGGSASISATSYVYPSNYSALQPSIGTAPGAVSVSFDVGASSTALLFNGVSWSIQSRTGLLTSAVLVLAGVEGTSLEGLSASTIGTSITAQYTTATSTLVLSGLSTVAEFVTVLNTVSYFDMSTVELTGLRSVQVTVSSQDGVVSNGVTATVTGTLCVAPMAVDLVFVLDSSVTVSSNWNITKQYAASIVRQLPIGASQIRFAMLAR